MEIEIVEQNFEFWGQCPTGALETITTIEKAGRVCYRTEDKITSSSAPKFVLDKIERGHGTVIEQSNIVVKTSCHLVQPNGFFDAMVRLFGERRAYHTILLVDSEVFISGSLRAWLETLSQSNDFDNLYFDELRSLIRDYFAEVIELPLTVYSPGAPEKATFEIVTDHAKIPMRCRRYQAKFLTNRGVTHEFVRHRPCSFLQESTRYVEYGGKYNFRFIKPVWSKMEPGVYDGYSEDVASVGDDIFVDGLLDCARTYAKLRDIGWSPQMAREVLPNALAAEIICCADLKEWNIIFDLRTTKAAHPQIRDLMGSFEPEFVNNLLVVEIEGENLCK